MYTSHARDRIRQRAIPELVVDLLMEVGDAAYDKHGAEIYYFGKKGKRRLASRAGRRLARHLEGYLGCYAVVANGQVITCGYRTRHVRRS